MPSSVKRISAGTICHMVFSYGIMLLWGISNIYRGLTRTVGMTSYPYTNRPGHVLIIAAGALEIALGVYQFFVRRALIRDDGKGLKGLDATLILSVLKLILWETLFCFYLQMPASAFKSGFWFQLATAVIAFMLIHLFYRKRSA